MSTTYNQKVLGTGIKLRDLVFNPVSGYTRAQFDILVRRIGFTDGGATATAAERSAWSFTGYTATNTDEGTDGKAKLYVKITGTTDAVVTVYKDAACTASVCGGTDAGRAGGVLSLTELNSSGLTGSVTLDASCTNENFTMTIEDYHDRYDHSVDGSSSNIIGIDNGLNQDITDVTADDDIVELVYEADGVNLDELGKDNVNDMFTRRTLIDNLKLKNITIV
jgi:hypothetical protein